MKKMIWYLKGMLAYIRTYREIQTIVPQDAHWLMSWDKEDQALHWFYGKIEDCPGHPVNFIGLGFYIERAAMYWGLPPPESGRRISFREWCKLMEVRDTTPQGLVRPMQKFSDDFFALVASNSIFHDHPANEKHLIMVDGQVVTYDEKLHSKPNSG